MVFLVLVAPLCPQQYVLQQQRSILHLRVVLRLWANKQSTLLQILPGQWVKVQT